MVEPTFVEALPDPAALRAQVDDGLWRAIVEEPLGTVIEERFADDLVRGVVATDALIGTFADLHDPSLIQNRCFLYHLIGNGTGEWRVPVGGMGAVTDALARSAVEAGAEILTSAGVSRIEADADGAEVTWHDGTRHHSVRAQYVLGNVAPWVLQILLGSDPDPTTKPGTPTSRAASDRRSAPTRACCSPSRRSRRSTSSPTRSRDSPLLPVPVVRPAGPDPLQGDAASDDPGRHATFL